MIASSANAGLTITLDFSHDDALTNSFWSGGTEGDARRSALQAAVNDINAVLSNDSLSDITSDPVTTVTGGTSVTFDAIVSYTNPVTGAATEISDLTTLGTDEFRLFVGARDLPGNTLAQGGRAGVGYGLSGSALESEWIAAVDAGEAAFNTQFERGGPVMQTVSGTSTVGATTASFDLNYGLTVGHLWFDSDTNNNGSRDTDMELDAFWHSDSSSTTVTSGEFDVYTVGLHEVLHTIGFADSNNAFSGNVIGGNDWTGAAVIALLGSGTDVLEPTSTSHLNLLTSSTVYGTSTVQDAVMEPSLASGERRFLTELDVAVLDDMGFSPVPEVTSLPVLAAALLSSVLLVRRRRSYADPSQV